MDGSQSKIWKKLKAGSVSSKAVSLLLVKEWCGEIVSKQKIAAREGLFVQLKSEVGQKRTTQMGGGGMQRHSSARRDLERDSSLKTHTHYARARTHTRLKSMWA